MITRNEKAKGLWWRLLATLPVLALLLIANTKVTAQEKKAADQPITVEMGAFELYSDDGLPIQLKDTVIYNEDGSYVKCETSDAFDPISGEPRKKMTITTHNADGTTAHNMNLHWEIDGDVTRYIAEPFSITSGESLLVLAEGLSALGNPTNADTVYNIVEKMPEFPGGEQAMMKFIAENVKYPEKAKDEGVMGRVFLSFVVEKDGSVNEVKVLRGIGGGCDEEAVRVIKSMPKWKPGIQKGKPVRVSFQMPFVFKLDESATNDKVYDKAEVMPEYPGGEQAMMNFVATNVKYPQAAIDKNISGRVMVGFVVEKDGSITDVQVVKGVGGGCNEEAVRVVKAMPKWKPGKEKGKAVRVHYLLPITFKLK